MWLLLPLLLALTPAHAAPHRPKSLAFDPYDTPHPYDSPDLDLIALAMADSDPIGPDANDIARTAPNAKNKRYNSPIYYIRLPPQPYMFVPGMGYVSPPAPQDQHAAAFGALGALGPFGGQGAASSAAPGAQFLNLPVSFLANGKVGGIYQWGTSGGFGGRPSGNFGSFGNNDKNSQVHKLPGKYSFNGRPEDILVLRDSYNSLYSDALQNFYP